MTADTLEEPVLIEATDWPAQTTGSLKRAKLIDRLATSLMWLASIFLALVLFGVIAMILIAGLPVLTWDFLTTAGTITASATTNAGGIASATLASGATVLTANITATASGYSATTSVAFTAGVPAAISLNAAPNTAVPGGNSAITAAVVDGGGNPVAN